VKRSGEWLKGVDTETGKVLVKGRWSSYQHCITAVFMALYEVDHPLNTCRGKREFLEAAWKSGEYILRKHRDDGKLLTVKPDGTEWGYAPDPWVSCSLSEVYRRSKHLMTERQRAFWQEKMKRVWASNAKHSRRTHNHDAWHAISAYVGAVAREDEQAKKGFAGRIRRIARAQSGDGYWKEWTGPVMIYNHLYVQAIAMYYLISKDEQVEETLRRAGRYHSYFMYPDGSCISMVSGRIGYDSGRHVKGLPGIDLTAEGTNYLKCWVRQSQRPGTRDVTDVGLNGFMFLGAALLYAGDALKHSPIGKETRDWAPAGIPARKMGAGPWMVCLSGITGRSNNRWAMERSVNVSVWNERSGLLCGGQLSRGQPQWSNFAFSDKPDGYCARRGEIQDTGGVTGLSLQFEGENRGWIRVRETTDTRLTLEFTARSDRSITGGLPLYIHYPDALKGKRGTLARPPAYKSRTWTFEELGGVLDHRGVRIHLPESATFAWPFGVYNPYHPKGMRYSYNDRHKGGSGKCRESFGVIQFPLKSGQPVRVVFEQRAKTAE
jgi:hypothetical protein